jgi:hypothetical protein
MVHHFIPGSKSSEEVPEALRGLEAYIDTVPAPLHTAQRLLYHVVRKSYIFNQRLLVQAQVVRVRGHAVTG